MSEPGARGEKGPRVSTSKESLNLRITGKPDPEQKPTIRKDTERPLGHRESDVTILITSVDGESNQEGPDRVAREKRSGSVPSLASLISSEKIKAQEYDNTAFEADGNTDPGAAANSVTSPTDMASSIEIEMTSPAARGGTLGADGELSTSRSSLADIAKVMALTQTSSSSNTSLNVPADEEGMGRRKSSIVDIAFAVAQSRQTSLLDISFRPTSGRLKKSQYRYMHPYGNSSSIVEELFNIGVEEEDDKSRKTGMDTSPMKMVVWMVFACCMIGMAGAIILGSETFTTKRKLAKMLFNTTNSGLQSMNSTIAPG